MKHRLLLYIFAVGHFKVAIIEHLIIQTKIRKHCLQEKAGFYHSVRGARVNLVLIESTGSLT